MKINRLKIAVVILLGMVLILFLTSFILYKNTKISNKFYDEFKENLIYTVETEDAFYMHELTNFAWDKMYIIKPYISKTEMQEIIGIKWTTCDTYVGYLWEKTYFGNNPLDDDIFHKLVFVKDKKVILDITLTRDTADFVSIDDIITCDDDYLTIDKTDKRNLRIKKL